MSDSMNDTNDISGISSEAMLDGRYSRQVLFDGLGREGQLRLMESRVLIVGCGALGTALANTMVRGGVGFVRIVDRDFVEESNLQRQQLFTTEDCVKNLPKAEAARRHLQAINPYVTLDTRIMDVDATNIESLIEDVDIILDGSDNFEIRYLINDVAVKHKLPWVYGGVLGSTGACAAFIPEQTGCLRCLFPQAPSPGTTGSCDTAGVLNTIVPMVANLQATRAMQVLCGNKSPDLDKLISLDVWDMHFSCIKFAQQENCPTCVQHEFDYLKAERGSFATHMCGRRAYQLSWKEKQSLDLAHLAEQLKSTGEVSHNAFLLKYHRDRITMTLFPDGRAIIEGVESPMEARKVYNQCLG